MALCSCQRIRASSIRPAIVVLLQLKFIFSFSRKPTSSHHFLSNSLSAIEELAKKRLLFQILCILLDRAISFSIDWLQFSISNCFFVSQKVSVKQKYCCNESEKFICKVAKLRKEVNHRLILYKQKKTKYEIRPYKNYLKAGFKVYG